MLVPKLRFPLFCDQWDYQKLGNVIDLFSGIALKSEEISEDPSGIPILRGINITEGRIRHSKEIDRFFKGNINKIIKYYVKEHDLVLGMDGSKVGKNVALITKKDENSILIQRVSRIRSKSNSNIIFIYQHIFSKKFHDYVDIVNTSSGIPHISLQQIKDFQIGFPSLPEQQKIASFLSTVDEKINLLKKQLTLLEQYKKGVMQKIFSREIRFKDDEGNEFPEWEEKKLREVCKISKGVQLNKEFLTITGEYPCINGGINPSGFTNNFNTRKNTITISEGGNSCGFVNLIKVDFWCGGHCYTMLNLEQSISMDYLFQFLKYNEVNIMSLRVGSGLPNIQKKDLDCFLISQPTLQEQSKIASFLSEIDETIDKNKNQIRKMELWKKGLLQQMFV
jgi:type I restriction enzyme S subunit